MSRAIGFPPVMRGLGVLIGSEATRAPLREIDRCQRYGLLSAAQSLARIKADDRLPPLDSLEVVEYLRAGPFALPDAAVHTVQNVTLPIPMAGHVGFNDRTGVTVLAGGHGGDTGPHLRRVVIILDARTTPPIDCR